MSDLSDFIGGAELVPKRETAGETEVAYNCVRGCGRFFDRMRCPRCGGGITVEGSTAAPAPPEGVARALAGLKAILSATDLFDRWQEERLEDAIAVLEEQAGVARPDPAPCARCATLEAALGNACAQLGACTCATAARAGAGSDTTMTTTAPAGRGGE